MLASPEIFQAKAAEQGLSTRESDFYGADYARTLMRWDEAVWAARESIIADRGESFFRMWRYYLAYCAAGFTSGNIDLMQIALERE
jgi:cyclopropane-fatty-acyl-phospholipid synthase